ncbi:type I phosphomannose isomerase catalytic subunit [Clostridium thermarum]|uniref:type I phosphomannose isomerase catalytic subunit n=1 Tax=Clostridium thermarum TaxID=1716543 RepID=UPI0013D11400|nr:type I phosphomannose isomerase catalytic subunit [Clostridium thermarum]
MYPLKFESIYFEKIWGGRELETLKVDLPEGDIGESWDVACHEDGTSKVANGQLKGMSLDKLIVAKGDQLVGTKISKDRFPLLLKLINSNDKLSIQVHPDDEYGFRVENGPGKTEAWYVVDAKEGAELIVGVKEGCTKEQFRKSIEEGTLEQYMNKVKIKKGETYFIRSGLMHAICEGAIIAEIQQNSNTTYRVYDYNRGREVHIDKAMDVVNLNLKGKKSEGLKIEKDGYIKTYLCLAKEFSLEKYDVEKELTEYSDPERFFIFTCVEGSGVIEYDNGSETITRGESVLIPAALGKYIFKGKMVVLKSYVPDVSKVEKEILEVVKG